MIIVNNLSKFLEVPTNQLVGEFTGELFIELRESQPKMQASTDDSLALLSNIDGYIHVEVAKFYPHAPLPILRDKQISDEQVHYRSSRRVASFSSFVHGLLLVCAGYFNQEFVAAKIAAADAGGVKVTFEIVPSKLEPYYG